MELDFLLLALVGIFAGFMNTLAGGGSLLTLPALMLFGLPADFANGTNRVAVLAQALASVTFFDREGKFDRRGLGPLLVPALLGASVGAASASQIPASYLKPILLLVMTTIALTMLFAPKLIAPEPTDEAPRAPDKKSFITFFAIGLYGGFAQAGVGIFLLAGLGGLLRYDLVHANGMKSAIAAAFTALSLLIFLAAGQVEWLPGLALAAGMVLGARVAVFLAIKSGNVLLHRIVLVLVLISCGAAWLN
ncbi:MAG: sulfite exporter TauE/SafE family protein [Candidatus Binatia bacterium]|nr:sulfite exporter TauE/SafE family protein [Candidatus Binatia bacterium]MDG2011321.1 sulfite exporter TauE/SafE family protein [Candidatus Binatia bacterium]HAC79483.1 sulfite exporter TauE/SafE family protein [Deltaproteobacteria bacterium]